MKFNDAISGGVLLALALAVIVHSWGMPKIPGQFVGPDLFPSLIAVALGAGALVLIARGLRARATVSWVRLGAWTRQPDLLLRFATVPAFVLIYVLLSEAIGFVPIAFVGLAILFLVAGIRWTVALPVAAIATSVIYYAFAVILRVPLPRISVFGVDALGWPF